MKNKQIYLAFLSVFILGCSQKSKVEVYVNFMEHDYLPTYVSDEDIISLKPIDHIQGLPPKNCDLKFNLTSILKNKIKNETNIHSEYSSYIKEKNKIILISHNIIYMDGQEYKLKEDLEQKLAFLCGFSEHEEKHILN